MFSVGDNVAGKYIIEKQLTPGQFGSVFLAHNYAMNRHSFLKLVPCKDPSFLKELVEAYSQNCNHPNVGRIYSAEVMDLADPEGSSVFVLMEQEFLEGNTLQSLIENGYTPLSESVRCLIGTLHALEYLQGNGITHGDVKPNNIMVVDGTSKLVDFGLARNASLAGAPRARDEIYSSHASPEFAKTKEIDERTDIYSCGVTLFRAVNQIVDWHGLITSNPNWKKLRDNGKLFSQVGFNPEVPRTLRRIVNRACSANANSRYQTATEFRRALDGLRFIRNWRRINVNEWFSESSDATYSLVVRDVKGGFLVVSKRNNRRIDPDHFYSCRNEAEIYLQNYLYKNTLA